ncbi:hypothetical protein GAR05_03038 [Micromonospora saelicesensis]|uniref:Uncharacterized protein n=1 Tax=Micromonospora saelicesensis TaxID=285676 RepID=A0ABX9CHY0_9ACTN|nr:hypothetical protein GAR05_03038 [Micromonospora saelicesensis]
MVTPVVTQIVTRAEPTPATAPPAIPSAIDPPSWRAGRRPARHVKRTLTLRSDAGGSGGGLLGLPGSMADGMASPQAPTDRDPPTAPRPSWSRSAPTGGAVAVTPQPPPARRGGRRALPHAARARGRAAKPAAGPHLTGHRSVVLRHDGHRERLPAGTCRHQETACACPSRLAYPGQGVRVGGPPRTDADVGYALSAPSRSAEDQPTLTGREAGVRDPSLSRALSARRASTTRRGARA